MTDPVLKELMQKAEAEFPALIEKAIKKLYQHEFADFDCQTLHKMKPEELAAWQAKYPMDSPQYIIALQEWNRRALAKQSKWMKFSVILTAVATIVAAILGAFVGANLSKSPQQNQQQPSIVQNYKSPSETTLPNQRPKVNEPAPSVQPKNESTPDNR